MKWTLTPASWKKLPTFLNTGRYTESQTNGKCACKHQSWPQQWDSQGRYKPILLLSWLKFKCLFLKKPITRSCRNGGAYFREARLSWKQQHTHSSYFLLLFQDKTCLQNSVLLSPIPKQGSRSLKNIFTYIMTISNINKLQIQIPLRLQSWRPEPKCHTFSILPTYCHFKPFLAFTLVPIELK